jgi:riboflavin kinase / FMN adenylyltransferase
LKLFHSITDFVCTKNTIATIGTFDGVHLGHQKILKKLIADAKNSGLETVLLTFEKHPRNILNENLNIKVLTTNEEKASLLQTFGIENLIIHPFNEAFSELSGEDFVKNILVDQLKIKKIIIGYDHRFGKNRSSDIQDLIQFSKKYHFEVVQISAEELNEIAISSTQIRNAIKNGKIALANQFLGYHFSFSGTVVLGKQLGRTIGFPTANIEIPFIEKIIPKNGVYIVQGYWANKTQNGIMNIGLKPTVDGLNQTIEVHFFNLNENLYGKEIKISFLEFIRDEKKFNSVEELKNQIQNDKVTSQEYFNKIK